MEMAGIVTHTGANIIKEARIFVEKVGRPLELDTGWQMRFFFFLREREILIYRIMNHSIPTNNSFRWYLVHAPSFLPRKLRNQSIDPFYRPLQPHTNLEKICFFVSLCFIEQNGATSFY